MKTQLFRAVCFLIICLTLPLTTAAQSVDISDANLRAVIEKALRPTPGDPITPAKMTTLNRLEARNANIRNLIGLESAINLTNLNLASNMISDIARLDSLTNLADLNLANNMSIRHIACLEPNQPDKPQSCQKRDIGHSGSVGFNQLDGVGY